MPWTDGLDEATVGHASLNGWKADGNLEEIARAAVQKHLEASKIIGSDPNQFLRFPSDPKDVDGWAKVYERLGVPGKPDDYKFDGVKYADGSEFDPAVAKMLRDTAASLKLTPDQAAQFASTFAKWVDEAGASEVSEAGVKRAAEEVDLHKSWGSNYEAFRFQTDRAASLLGLDPDMVGAIEGQLGLVKAREALRVFAAKVGEAAFVGGEGGGGGNKAMTREEALAEHGRLMADKGWVTRYMSGDKEARDYMGYVNRQIVGVPRAA